jgi:hypothetical protein
MACDERYFRQLHDYYATRRAALCDPDRPWMRKPIEPDHDCSGTHDEARAAAYFKARQLDLFDSSAGWDDLWENDF